MLKCMNDDNAHNPDYLIKIHESLKFPCSEEVVRWCPICGAIVVDTDYDGRTNPGQVMKMRFPTNERSE